MVSKHPAALVSETREQGCSERCRGVSGRRAQQHQRWMRSSAFSGFPVPSPRERGGWTQAPGSHTLVPCMHFPECPVLGLLPTLGTEGRSAAGRWSPSLHPFPPGRAPQSHPRWTVPPMKMSLNAPTGLHQAPGQRQSGKKKRVSRCWGRCCPLITFFVSLRSAEFYWPILQTEQTEVESG